jgi:hypothetical protein
MMKIPLNIFNILKLYEEEEEAPPMRVVRAGATAGAEELER